MGYDQLVNSKMGEKLFLLGNEAVVRGKSFSFWEMRQLSEGLLRQDVPLQPLILEPRLQR